MSSTRACLVLALVLVSEAAGQTIGGKAAVIDFRLAINGLASLPRKATSTLYRGATNQLEFYLRNASGKAREIWDEFSE